MTASCHGQAHLPLPMKVSSCNQAHLAIPMKANRRGQVHLTLPKKAHSNHQARQGQPMGAGSPQQSRRELTRKRKGLGVAIAEQMEVLLLIPLQASARKSTTK